MSNKSVRLRWSGSITAQKEYEGYIKAYPLKPKKKKSKGQKRKERKLRQQQKLKVKPKKVNKPKRVYVPDYQSYLQSNWWKSKRLDKLKSVGYKCERCGKVKDLQVHHLHYKSLTRELNKDLEVLCKFCHEIEHEAIIQCQSHLTSINNLSE